MYVMGINSAYHESSACMIKDGKILMAVEEERFNRFKHGKKANSDNPDELPVNAIRACLESANIKPEQIMYIGYAYNPSRTLDKTHLQSKFFLQIDYDNLSWSLEDESLFAEKMSKIPDKVANMGFTGKFLWIDHHTAHAASAFYASPFYDAAVLSIDGIGEINSTSFFEARQHSLKFLQEIFLPNSLGFLWELISVFLGFEIYDAYKTMGLAAYGNPERYYDKFWQIVRIIPDGKFETDDTILHIRSLNYLDRSGYYNGLEEVFGIKRRSPKEELTSDHHNIAAALQSVTNEVVMHAVKYLYEQVNSENLCMAGGVALNCVTNRFIFENGPFKNLYVQPASHDGGTAIGAALYIWHHLLKQKERNFMPHAYLGPSFSDSEIEMALSTNNIRNYRRMANIEQEVARLISRNYVVGFFQDKMEFGPRALGNRSLLADPRNPDMRDILNHKVKHREYFRPFAPSVLHEEAKDWFHILKDTSASEFMLMAYPVKEHMREKIPAVVHADGTCRIQAVRKETNPRYHALISEFYKLTGVPVVLNTSFNDSEPIVCSPWDAINTFLKTEIDYLALGDFLVKKGSLSEPDCGRRDIC